MLEPHELLEGWVTSTDGVVEEARDERSEFEEDDELDDVGL